MKQWFLLENEKDYKLAKERYQQLREARRSTPEHKEKLLLAHLINHYVTKNWKLPPSDPIELIKARMEDFGYTATDLARVYGDKGTVSKVLNYKQALSLTMIRKFSKLLNMPLESLIKEYKLRK